MIKEKSISIVSLREAFSYDAETGKLFDLRKNGKEITVRDHRGYIAFGAFNVYLRGHRVAWALHHGRWPDGYLDHINNVHDDNRIANLREATASQNTRNQGKGSRGNSKYKGVFFDKSEGIWRASITADGKAYYCGRHRTEEAAAKAYNEAAKRLHGEFAYLNDVVTSFSDSEAA